MKILLLYPPLTDPTAPYHSLSYLKSFLSQNGIKDVQVKDLNIELLDFLSKPLIVDKILRLSQTQFNLLRKSSTLDFKKQENLISLSLALGERLDPEAPQKAVSVLRNAASFFRFENYDDSIRIVLKWLSLISAAFPGSGFNSVTGKMPDYRFNAFNFLETVSFLNSVGGPVDEFCQSVLLPALLCEKYDVVGISITYFSQYLYGLYFARAIKSVLPKTKVCLGGAAISQIFRCTFNKQRLLPLFDFIDAIVIGDGEIPFLEYVRNILNGTDKPVRSTVISRVQSREIKFQEEYQPLNLDELPTPYFDDLPWNLYFSPSRLICYSPNRGCYWNRCAFCSFGYSNKTGNSWRERSTANILTDLKLLSEKYPFIYFAVDTFSPRQITEISKGIVSEKIPIYWAAEINVNALLDKRRCHLLKDSGCIALSIGYETSCDRLLALMDKGINKEAILTAFKNANEVEIPIQIMGFTDFPTESFKEAQASLAFLRSNKGFWHLGGLGEFQLLEGSHIAANPSNFGLSPITRPRNVDFLFSPISAETNISKTKKERELIERGKKDTNMILFPRPFLGGVDSSHSLFYFKRFGRFVFRDLMKRKRSYLMIEKRQKSTRLHSLSKELGVSLRAIVKNIRDFNAFRRNLVKRGLYFDRKCFEEFVTSVPLMINDKKQTQ